MLKEVKTVRVSSKRQISLPTSFKKLKGGDKVLMKIEDDKIIIEPFTQYSIEELCSLNSQKAFEENWLLKEDEVAYGHLQKYKK